MRRLSCSNARCPVCGTRPDLCICAELPSLRTRCRFVFVQHSAELRKPTNTARLACRVLSDAVVVPWERTNPPAVAESAILLYPFPDAPLLEPIDMTENVQVFVPDGTWNQTGRIANELRRRGATPRRLLEEGMPAWRIRTATEPDRVSSGQAVAAALGVAGDATASNALAEALSEAARRILSMRGLTPDGVPLSRSQQAGTEVP